MSNREYKSDVFSMLLEDKARALEVYNAVAGTDYDNPEIIEICTLENGMYLSIRNDASFIVSTDSTLNIFEHQSTYNPNMPLRQLLYFTTIIKDIIDERYIYSRKLVKIPTPKFAVFYNGEEKRPETEVVKLSDAFINNTEAPELELICKLYNINPGNNGELLNRCNTLREYMIFIGYVKNNLKMYGKTTEGYDRALSEAINRCIDEDILKEFFMNRGEEVQKVMMFDLTFEKQMRNAKREWYDDGFADGKAEGFSDGFSEGYTYLINMIITKVRKRKTINQIADELEMDKTEISPIYESVLKHAPEYDVEEILKDIMPTLEH